MNQKYILIVSSVLLLNSVVCQTLLDPCERKPCQPREICISKGNLDFVCVDEVSSSNFAKIIPIQNERFGVGYSRQASFVASERKPDTNAHDDYILNMMAQPESQETVMVPVNRPSVQTNKNGRERIMNIKNTVRISAQNNEPVPIQRKNGAVSSSNDDDILNMVQSFGRNSPLRNPFNAGFMDQTSQMEVQNNPVQQSNLPNMIANGVVPSSNDHEILNTVQSFGRKQPISNPFGVGRMVIPQNNDAIETMDVSVSLTTATPKVEVPVKLVKQPEVTNNNEDDHILSMILGFNPRPMPVSNPFNAGRLSITKNNDEKMKVARLNTEVPKPVEQSIVQQSNMISNLHKEPLTITTNDKSKNTKPIGRLFPVKTALPIIRAEMDNSEDAYVSSMAAGSQQQPLHSKSTKVVSKDVPSNLFNTLTTTTATTSKKNEIAVPKPNHQQNEHDDHIIRMINANQDQIDLTEHVESYDLVDDLRPRETQNEYSLEEGMDAAGSDSGEAENGKPMSLDEHESDYHKSGETKKALSDTNQTPVNPNTRISGHEIVSSAMKMPFNEFDRKRIGLHRPNTRISVYNPTQEDFASSRADFIKPQIDEQQPLPSQNILETQTANTNNKPMEDKAAPKFPGHARLNQEQQIIQPVVQPVVNDKDVSKIINSILPNKPGEKKLPSQIPASFNKNRYSLKNFILSTTSTTIKTPVHDSRAIFEAVQKMDEHEQGLIDGVLNVPDETVQSETMAKKPYCNGHEFGDQIAHPEDSTKFIVCQKDGEYIVMRCPGKLKYNKFKNRCDHTDRQPQKACLSNPCLNNGTCMDTADYDFICECRNGYSGDICDKFRDPCAFNPCGNENICYPLPPELYLPAFYCLCDGGNTYGLKCDDNNNKYKNPCLDDPHQTYYPTELRKSLFIHCENDLLAIKQCKAPLEWSQEKLSCIRPNNRVA